MVADKKEDIKEVKSDKKKKTDTGNSSDEPPSKKSKSIEEGFPHF